jgi:ubiquinone/menaquinone biosynthesis C-methylase UbiE
LGDTTRERNLAKTRDFYARGFRVAMEPVWGEHLHLGLFERPEDPLHEAQERAVHAMADGLPLSPESCVLEVACGLGPAARHLASRYGCRVLASNISERQLSQGLALTRDAGLTARVAFAGADFHRLPFAAGRFDLWWCQESLLHSPDKTAVLAEARRVLGPGGWLVLSDVTMAGWVGSEDRAAIYARVRSPGMWDRGDYDRALSALGFEVVRFEDWSRHVAPSYAAIRAAAVRHLERHPVDLPAADTDHALAQFQLWVDAAEAGKIGWVTYAARAGRD